MRISLSHVCLVLLLVSLSAALQPKRSVRRGDVSAWNQAKNRRLFARQKIEKMSAPLDHRLPGLQRHEVDKNNTVRRCGRLKEACSGLVSCCDPCASCRCRFFNTICHCWRMNGLCFRRM